MAESDTPSVDGLMRLVDECALPDVVRAYAERLAASPAGLKPELQKSELPHLTSRPTKDLQTALPEIIRILAEWEDANGSLSGAMYDEWIALYKPITSAAVFESPRMIRTALTRREASAGSAKPNEKAPVVGSPVSAVVEALQVLTELLDLNRTWKVSMSMDEISAWHAREDAMLDRARSLVGAPGVKE